METTSMDDRQPLLAGGSYISPSVTTPRTGCAVPEFPTEQPHQRSLNVEFEATLDKVCQLVCWRKSLAGLAYNTCLWPCFVRTADRDWQVPLYLAVPLRLG